jgi:hypothetical protein
MKLEKSLVDNKEFKELFKIYKLFYNDFEKFYNCFNKNTIDIYNQRYYDNKQFILPNNIKKSREIHYFYYLFNNYNK